MRDPRSTVIATILKAPVAHRSPTGSLLDLVEHDERVGMPVVVEVRRACQARTARASRRLSLHAVLTLGGTVILLAFGTGLIFLLERNATLQGMPAGQAVMNAGVHAVMLRTGGFNAIDLSKLSEAGALASAGLMLVGGGSGGTAGGIKITTLMVLIATVAAELRGRTDVTVRGRRLPSSVQREALALLFLAVAAVGLGATALMALMSLPMRDALFEAVSAFGTVGLTTGVTARLLDYIDFNDGFGVAKVSAPASLIGRALGDTMMGAEFGVTVVGLKRGAAPFVAATPETRVEAGDLLIVAADTQAIQRFARAG